jgi:thymidylate synthase
MEQYHNVLKQVLTDDTSTYKPNRTGVGTISLFGAQSRYKLWEGFPAMTTKKLHLKSIIHELIFFLHGETNVKYLNDNGVRIWNEWADKDGNLGPIYGYQWRSWPDYDGGFIDQLQEAVDTVRRDPDSRRILVSAWNVAQIKKMALAPCHVLYQMEVNERNGVKELDLGLYQRSCDIFLGVPFNIPSYALLAYVVANETGLKPGLFVHTYADLHIYCGAGDTGLFYKKNLDKIKSMVRNVDKREDYLLVRDELLEMMKSVGLERSLADHVPQCLEQLAREPRPLPKLILDERAGINDLLFEYIKLEGYDPHPHIKGEVAV